MKSKKQLKKQIKQYESKLKSDTLTNDEADKIINELDLMISQLEQLITINVNKLKNKL